MDPAVILLLLRLVGAALLLAFLGTILFLIYIDLRATRLILDRRDDRRGVLRVLPESTGARPGAVYPLLPLTSIGRASVNTVVVDDAFVSGEHALLMQRGRQWWVEDLNSRNGTRLNNLILDGATVVSSGDVITVGSTHLKVEIGKALSSQSSAPL
ncbi:MAG: FHA domain-containing protein [Candidatus Promineifilaceae bacterium]|nr:FHA domain-containing protein [Candidatus Promineifilaceae bacterium]